MIPLLLWAREEVRFVRASFPAAADGMYLPPTSLLRYTTLGHRELAADLVWIKSIIYYGEQISKRGQFRDLERHIDTVIALDPRFHTIYKWAGTVTMYRAGKIPQSAVRSSIRYLERGVEQFPRDWELSFMLGCDYLFELRSDDPAAIQRNRSLGATYVERAALIGGGPPWLATLAATMRTRAGQSEAAVRYLEQAYLVTEDAQVREQIEGKLTALRGDVSELASAAQTFDQRWQSELPYVPSDLFLLLGGRGERGRGRQAPSMKTLIAALAHGDGTEENGEGREPMDGSTLISKEARNGPHAVTHE
jgi:hypothetical protein